MISRVFPFRAGAVELSCFHSKETTLSYIIVILRVHAARTANGWFFCQSLKFTRPHYVTALSLQLLPAAVLPQNSNTKKVGHRVWGSCVSDLLIAGAASGIGAFLRGDKKALCDISCGKVLPHQASTRVQPCLHLFLYIAEGNKKGLNRRQAHK